MRSLLFTEPVDFLIGNTYGKYLERDTGTPLIRIGFPVFDRHHHHRYPVWGYQGGMNVLVWILTELRRDRSEHHRSGEDGLQLRHHSLRARPPVGPIRSTGGPALIRLSRKRGEANEFAFSDYSGCFQRTWLRQKREQIRGRAKKGMHEATPTWGRRWRLCFRWCENSASTFNGRSAISCMARSPAKVIHGIIEARSPLVPTFGALVSQQTSTRQTSYLAAKSVFLSRLKKLSINTILRRCLFTRHACLR